MAYRVDYRPSARRELARLPKRARHGVLAALETLSANPRPARALWMWGDWEGYWRLVVGECRIVYAVNDRAERVTVVRIGHRSDVYEGGP